MSSSGASPQSQTRMTPLQQRMAQQQSSPPSRPPRGVHRVPLDDDGHWEEDDEPKQARPSRLVINSGAARRIIAHGVTSWKAAPTGVPENFFPKRITGSESDEEKKDTLQSQPSSPHRITIRNSSDEGSEPMDSDDEEPASDDEYPVDDSEEVADVSEGEVSPPRATLADRLSRFAGPTPTAPAVPLPVVPPPALRGLGSQQARDARSERYTHPKNGLVLSLF